MRLRRCVGVRDGFGVGDGVGVVVSNIEVEDADF